MSHKLEVGERRSLASHYTLTTASKALRYGTRSQGISQFYLHTPRSSAIGMNHTCLAFPAKAGTHLPTPEGWKAELTLGGWLVTYRNKCPAPGIVPGHGLPSQY